MNELGRMAFTVLGKMTTIATGHQPMPTRTRSEKSSASTHSKSSPLKTRRLIRAVSLILITGLQGACFSSDDFSTPECFWSGDITSTKGCDMPIQISAGGAHTCVVRKAGSLECWGSNLDSQLGIETSVRIDAVHFPMAVPDMTEVSQVSTGWAHTCAIQNDTIYCWGDNERGQSGFAPTAQSARSIIRPLPIASTTQKNWEMVSAGGSHSCALTKGGDVWCWGDNRWGQVSHNIEQEWVATPHKKAFGATVMKQISAGLNHSCAHNGQNIFCWGQPSLGKTGRKYDYEAKVYEDMEPSQISRAWSVGTTIVDLDAGREHSCVLIDDGEIYCWGSSKFGQFTGLNVNTGSSVGSSTNASPAEVKEQTMMRTVHAGRLHSCTVSHDGEPYCWGSNRNYQLGDGSNIDREMPAPIRGPHKDVVQISVGGEHACALKRKTGEVLCWGLNEFGQAGQPFREESMKSQRTVNDLTTITRPDPNSRPVDGGLLADATPIPDTGPADTGPADAGVFEDAMLSPDTGTVAQDAGFIQDAMLSPDTGTVAPDAGVIQDAMTSPDAGFIVDAGFILDTGPADTGPADTGPADAGLTTQCLGEIPSQVSSGQNHNCAIISGGQVCCWGSNAYGELGANAAMTGFATQYPDPLLVPGIVDATQLASGSNFTCALKADQTIWCWGSNYENVISPSVVFTQYDTPTRHSFGNGFNQICAGAFHVCALRSGAVYCWGGNNRGQSGGAYQMIPIDWPRPVAITLAAGGAATIVEVACGYGHSCARDQNGAVFCWGSNETYELTAAATSTVYNAPVRIDGLSPSTGIEAGLGFTCSQTTSNRVECWGINEVFQVGTKTATASESCVVPFVGPLSCTSTAATVPHVAHVDHITIGPEGEHACARLSNGEAQCWGSDQSQELGDTNQAWNGSEAVSVEDLVSAHGNQQIHFEQISAGTSHTCAIATEPDATGGGRSPNRVYCWGYSPEGQAGIIAPTVSVPSKVNF
jgi:alpha-tubulin suppressor-like RCC1 family protein